jgi:hypothetical protein
MRPAATLGCLATVGLTFAACGGGSSGVRTSGTGAHANTSAYCNQARQVQQADSPAAAASPGGLKNLFASFDKLASVAPGQIAPSVHTLSGFYDRFLSALGSASPSDQTAVRNAESTALGNQQSQVQGAAQKVLDYTKKTCNIDLSGSPSGSTTTTSP